MSPRLLTAFVCVKGFFRPHKKKGIDRTMKFYLEGADKVLADVKSTADGLSSAEAQKRLDQNGKNKLK